MKSSPLITMELIVEIIMLCTVYAMFIDKLTAHPAINPSDLKVEFQVQANFSLSMTPRASELVKASPALQQVREPVTCHAAA